MTYLQCQSGSGSLEGWGRVLWEAEYALNQVLIHSTVCLIPRIQGIKNSPTHYHLYQLTRKMFIPCSHYLKSADLKILVLERGALFPGDTTLLLNWKLTLHLPSNHVGLLMPLSLQAKKGISARRDA
jgi:hypothetical protein